MLDECPNCGYRPCVAPGCIKHGNIDGRCVDHHIEKSAEDMTDLIKREMGSNLGKDNSDD